MTCAPLRRDPHFRDAEGEQRHHVGKEQTEDTFVLVQRDGANGDGPFEAFDTFLHAVALIAACQQFVAYNV